MKTAVVAKHMKRGMGGGGYLEHAQAMLGEAALGLAGGEAMWLLHCSRSWGDWRAYA